MLIVVKFILSDLTFSSGRYMHSKKTRELKIILLIFIFTLTACITKKPYKIYPPIQKTTNYNTLKKETTLKKQTTPPNPIQEPRYAGITTFAKLPLISNTSEYDIAILGIPFDSGCSFRPGARLGPSAVREASRFLRPGFNPGQNFNVFKNKRVVDAGDIPCSPYDIKKALTMIEDYASKLQSKSKRIISVGGDHTIAYPLLKAINKHHGPVALIHFDAHLDTWDQYFGEHYTHGTPFRRAFEENLLIKESSIHIGIRGPVYDEIDFENDKKCGFSIISCREIEQKNLSSIIKKIKKRVGTKPVYLSIDIDVLDPAFAPGTGTPEAAGMTSRELLEIIRGISDLNVVGADVVEVSPAYDNAQITSLAAATLVFELISVLAKSMNQSDKKLLSQAF